MDRRNGALRYNRIDESSSASSRSARPGDKLDRHSLSLKAILRPQHISSERRRATTGAIHQDRENLALEFGYPSVIDTNVMLRGSGSAMEDASSVSYEGFLGAAMVSFSDATDTDGSFRTAQMIPATVKSMSIGSGDFSNNSDHEFLTCREGSDQFSATASIFADANSYAHSSRQDSDGDSFYTCRRFNDQGLRSVLAVPTNVNTDLAFNIPLHVFAQTIEEAALRKQTEDFRNHYIWRPVKAMSLLAVLAVAIALAIVLTRDRHTTDVPNGADSTVTPAADTIPSAIPSVTPAPAWPSTSAFPMPSANIIEILTPSVAPWRDDDQQTLGPTSFVFTAGNFEEIDDIPVPEDEDDLRE